MSDDQWRERVTEDLAATCGQVRAQGLVHAWSALTGRVDMDVLELLADVRRRVPVVLVSNATTRLEDDLAALGLADAFDAVINTARIGVAKPDRRVFEAAARSVAADLHRCLFIDDTPGHVTAARETGLTGLHYQHVDQLRSTLTPLLA
ncbi:HAD family hydrolase [Streptomyces virginiae]|uniref:HAD family hydrolase n=1 Tax=Streptomyces virginiae TaxID=1961 RepID=UPI0036E151F7